MPIFMDRHDIPGATAKKVAEAHQKDLKVQDRFNCKALTYWFDEKSSIAFCLVKAPHKQAVTNMHNSAHGLIPNKIIEVDERMVNAFLGRIGDPAANIDEGKHDTIINETGIRTLVHISLKYPQGYFKDISIDKAVQEVNEYYNYIDEEIKISDGRKVTVPDQGLIASFRNIPDSINCCKNILFRLKKRKLKIKASAGLSAGYPVGESNELFGRTFRAISSLSFAALPGNIYVSSSIRKILAGRISRLTSPDNTVKALIPEEQKFLDKLTDFTEKNWNSDNFTIDNCCRKIGLSKSKFYRETVSLTGNSPSEYLKEYRLKRALEMIKSHTGNITEIAFETGFNTPSYFSKCFYKRFGILPSVYLSSLS